MLQDVFPKHWPDRAILLLAILLSLVLLIEKAMLINVVWVSEPGLLDYLDIIRSNLFAYISIVLWVMALLIHQHGRMLLARVYVLVGGVVLLTVTRTIELNNLVTMHGADFDLANHFYQLVVGRGDWTEHLVLYLFRYGFFLLLLMGLVLRFRSLGESKRPAFFSLGGGASIFLLLAFLPAWTGSVPTSMGQHGLVYVIRTAYFPVEDVRQDSSFRFAESSGLEADGSTGVSLNADKKKNIVIIALESTGSNMLSFYPENDVPDVTPFLTELSTKSGLVLNATAVMASTTKSLVSVLCGVEPYPKPLIFEVTLGVPVKCLPTLLSAHGYDSAFFQSATKYYEGRNLLVEKMGFKEFYSVDELDKDGFQAMLPLGVEDNVLLKPHGEWIQKRDKPFLAFYMTLAQHFPYVGNGTEEGFQDYHENAILNRYLNSLGYVDRFLASIFDQYKQAGLYENTIFIIVGDHGESFGRYHRQLFHNNVLYGEGIRVPFFVHNQKIFPDQKEIEGDFSLIDVTPTILDFLGLSKGEGMRGASILNPIEKRVRYAACWYKNRCLARIDEQYKYIYNYQDVPDELYDLSVDPLEKNNLLHLHPELAASYKRDLIRWYSDMLNAYEAFFLENNSQYKTDSSSYYRFIN